MLAHVGNYSYNVNLSRSLNSRYDSNRDYLVLTNFYRMIIISGSSFYNEM